MDGPWDLRYPRFLPTFSFATMKVNCPLNFKPKYYKRYVDDTFLIFENEDQANNFLNYINSKHHKIKFTIENERKNKLPFLDMLISKRTNNFDTNIYRKPTHTNLGVNFISACYENFKFNTFNTLFFRAFRLTSNYEAFHKEICHLKTFFNANGYTNNIFFSKLRRFLNNIYDPPKKSYGPKKRNFYFRMPYFRDNTNTFLKQEITKTLKKYFPQLNPIAVFYNNFKIKNFINHKEKLSPSFESGIVYGYECPSCQLAYIGSTKQTLLSRIHEHKGVSLRTGRPYANPSFSAIRSHCQDTCNVSVNPNNFKILYRGRTESDIRIAESMYIKKIQHTLNNNLSSHSLKFC